MSAIRAYKQCESPSSSVPTYVFNGPSLIAIRTRTNDQPKYVDTRLSIWTWYDGGVAMKIDWAELNFSPDLMEIAKAFLAYALEKYAPLTAFSASVLLRRLAENVLSAGFPWALQDVVAAVNSWSKFRHSTVLFRTFYRWALNRGISGFNKETYLAIKEIKGKRNDPYERIFLAQSGLDLNEMTLPHKGWARGRPMLSALKNFCRPSGCGLTGSRRAERTLRLQQGPSGENLKHP